MELAGLDQEAHGNSCLGARLIPEIFLLCPWYKAEHLWPWYGLHIPPSSYLWTKSLAP